MSSVISVTHAEGLIRATLYTVTPESNVVRSLLDLSRWKQGKRDDTARRPVTKFAGRAHPRQDVTGDVSSVNSQKPETQRG